MNEYDIFKLKKDLNPIIPKNSEGVILIKYSENEFEVEFLDKDGINIEFDRRTTFTISKDFIELVSKHR